MEVDGSFRRTWFDVEASVGGSWWKFPASTSADGGRVFTRFHGRRVELCSMGPIEFPTSMVVKLTVATSMEVWVLPWKSSLDPWKYIGVNFSSVESKVHFFHGSTW